MINISTVTLSLSPSSSSSSSSSSLSHHHNHYYVDIYDHLSEIRRSLSFPLSSSSSSLSTHAFEVAVVDGPDDDIRFRDIPSLYSVPFAQNLRLLCDDIPRIC